MHLHNQRILAPMPLVMGAPPGNYGRKAQCHNGAEECAWSHIGERERKRFQKPFLHLQKLFVRQKEGCRSRNKSARHIVVSCRISIEMLQVEEAFGCRVPWLHAHREADS